MLSLFSVFVRKQWWWWWLCPRLFCTHRFTLASFTRQENHARTLQNMCGIAFVKIGAIQNLWSNAEIARMAILGQNLRQGVILGQNLGSRRNFHRRLQERAHVTENPVAVPNSNTSLGCATWPSFWWLFPHRHTEHSREAFIWRKIQNGVDLKSTKGKI